MADDPETSFDTSVGALNVDWTNRHKSVNSAPRLAVRVRADIATLLAKPDIVTISELSSKGAAALFTTQELAAYDAALFKVGRDYLQTLWNADAYALDNSTFQSAAGRYLGTLLEHRATKTRVLHFSVHMPHKSGKVEADRLLLQAIDELPRRHEVDYVLLSGDFNAAPDAIVARFPGFTTALTAGTGATTAAGRSIDNIAAPDDGLRLVTPAVWRQGIFSHHPISAKAEQR